MPELPEVETVRQVLIRQIVGKTIKKIEIKYPNIIENMTPDNFISSLIGQTFIDVQRKGKYLIFILDNGYLISHLRMEGKYKFDIKDIDKHCHVFFYFTSEDYLIYHDVRKFGKMFYFPKKADIYNLYPLNTLGIESFNLKDGEYLYNKTRASKKCLKEILLDQSIICGIGNIYADEICYQAKLSPLTIANKLTKNDCDILINATNIILTKAINLGGSTIKTYQSAHGVDGKFQNELQIYGKFNQKCPNCNGNIIKIRVGGRGTCYCPNCQHDR